MLKIYKKYQSLEPNSRPKSTSQVVFGLVWQAIFDRKIMLFSILVILITLPLLYLVYRYQPKVEAAWFDESFAYRQKVDITNSGGTNLTDFQVAITLNTASLISAGKMQSDCDDIRITDVNGKVLPHWIETGTNACNTTTTAIWTKVPSIPTSGATVYLYYGNPSATNTQNGDKVFEFFDDFSGSSLNTTKWPTTVGSPTVSSGVLVLDGTGSSNRDIVLGSYIVGTGYAVNFRHQSSVAGNISRFGIADAINDSWHGGPDDAIFQKYSNNYLYTDTHNNNSNTENQRETYDTNYHVYQVRYLSTSSVKFFADSNNWEHTTNVPDSTSLKVWIQGETGTVNVDWVFVRKTAATEPTVSSPTNEEKAQGPVAWWKFDEGYGTITNDQSPNSNNGTITGATWKSEDQCISGKCLYFDGSGDYVQVPDSPSNSVYGDMTISLWVKPNALSSRHSIISKHYNNEFDLIAESNGAISFYHGDGTWEQVGGFPGSTLSVGNWTHIAVVRTISDKKMYYYANGKLVSGPTSFTKTPTDSSYPVRIGYRGDSTYYFTGFIDEVKIYNYARTPAQIKADYLAGKAKMSSVKGSSVALGSPKEQGDFLTQGLVGYWKMDEASWTNDCSTATVIDASGNGNHGKSCPSGSGPTGGAAGKFGNGGGFDGSDDNLNIPDANVLDFGTNNFTIVGWFYVDPSSYSSNQERGLINKNSTYQNSAGWGMEISTWGKTSPFPDVNIYCYNTGQSSWGNSNVTYSSFTTNVWHHVVCVRSGTTFYMYLDGQLIATKTHSDVGLNVDNSQPIIIGDHSWGPNFAGKIDEVRIYNRALSPAEVRALYNFAPGPRVHLKMDEGTGTSAYDSSSNSRTGTIINGLWGIGKFGKGVNLDGSGDYLEINDF